VNGVRVPAPLLAAMKEHARSTYPNECCGYLIAPAELPPDGIRQIEAVERADNRFEGAQGRRFVIVPEELRAAEERAAVAGRAVVGFYHSHPDHPARPSAFDEEHAWPWYAYLVLATTAQDVPQVGAFELGAETGRFREVPLGPDREDDGAPPMAGA
jgi:proteasome lid subunit RPN8/RPN11